MVTRSARVGSRSARPEQAGRNRHPEPASACYGRDMTSAPKLEPSFADMRRMLISAKPADLGMQPTARLPRVWAAMMEMRLEHGYVTVASLADGTTSLYMSSGGGILGGGEHQAVQVATFSFLGAVEAGLDKLSPVAEPPLPAPGTIRLHALTYWSPGTLEAPEAEVMEGRHPLGWMFDAGNDVVTQLRLLQQHGERSSS
jgi:hypothetical protein